MESTPHRTAGYPGFCMMMSHPNSDESGGTVLKVTLAGVSASFSSGCRWLDYGLLGFGLVFPPFGQVVRVL